jgi:hypothetical protein
MASFKPIPGIITVNSDVIKPDELFRKDFDGWYCDEHIPDLVAKSGVQAAYRYEHMNNGSNLERRYDVLNMKTLSNQLSFAHNLLHKPNKIVLGSLGFLTIYPMPDINFMTTPEFRSLEGQSLGPSRTRIFEKAEFDTRSYELVQVHSAPDASPDWCHSQ